MATIDKALTLLGCFTPEQPSMKLTDLARLSGMNKAGVFRYLSGLSRAGLIEQDEETRHYRLGPEIVRLGQVRDATVPIRRWMRDPVGNYRNDKRNMSCRADGAGAPFTYMVNESQQSLQVRIDPGMNLPYHATASGQIFLAFASEEIVEAQLGAAAVLHQKYHYRSATPEIPYSQVSRSGIQRVRRRCRHGCDFSRHGLFRFCRSACWHHCDSGTSGAP